MRRRKQVVPYTHEFSRAAEELLSGLPSKIKADIESWVPDLSAPDASAGEAVTGVSEPMIELRNGYEVDCRVDHDARHIRFEVVVPVDGYGTRLRAPSLGNTSQYPEPAVPIITSQRAAFLSLALAQMHSPYRWNAKGQRVTADGPRLFDCSGLVTWCLHQVGGPDWRGTHNTDRLWTACPPVSSVADLLPGDLVLYGKAGDPEHVMVHVGAGVVVGASGGARTTLTLEDAVRADAKVKAFSRPEYRPDILGFRRPPFVS